VSLIEVTTLILMSVERTIDYLTLRLEAAEGQLEIAKITKDPLLISEAEKEIVRYQWYMARALDVLKRQTSG